MANTPFKVIQGQGHSLLVPIESPSVIERRNGRLFSVISPNSVAFAAYYVKVVEDTPTHSASEV